MIIARSPFRISFFGGGTDHPEYYLQEGGAVLTTAIDKYAYVTVNKFLSHMFEYAIRLSYSSVELAKTVDEVEHNIFRECLKRCAIEKDIAMHSIFDTHAFSGVGSSSSLTVSVLNALNAYKEKSLTPAELAREAIAVEKHMVRANVGCQDQVMAAYGGFKLIEFERENHIRVRDVTLSPLRLAELESHLFLVYTGIVRNASDITLHQVKRVNDNIPALRLLKSLAYEGRDILTKKKPLKEFGKMLHEAWEAKQSLDGGVSNPAIDDIYERGLKAGAWGGKLLGAGGGGFMLFFADPDVHPELKKVFPKKNILEVKINAPGSQIIYPAASQSSGVYETMPLAPLSL